MKILIKYFSLSGNTKEVACLIKKYIEEQGHVVFVSDIFSKENIEQYNLVIIGSMTIGEGELPLVVKEYLRWLLKKNDFDLPYFSVFGTGDTQWTHYCKAVDEMEYHLSKYTKVIGKLKIEQAPKSKNQKNKIIEYVLNVLKEENYETE